MKEIENSHLREDWIKIAKKDWDRVERMLEDDDLEGAGFFLQQSLEKYLKAFLVTKGWKLKKIHNLYTLLDEAIKYNSNLEVFRLLCERVSGYYFTERYPPLSEEGLTREDIEKDLKQSKRFIEILLNEGRGLL